jgi:hypothetical protein
MFTQVSFGQFLEPLFKQAHSRDGIEFSDQYPNLAVYTPQAVGLWGYEIVGGFSLRLFRWLTNIPEQVIRGPYENPDESPEEFRIRFEREFWAAIEALKKSGC